MPVPGDDITVVDSAKVGIVDKSDKPYRSPEHIAELNRRRAQIPQKWYPIKLISGWADLLRKDTWVKVVWNTGDVLIGKTRGPKDFAFRVLLYPDSTLYNGDAVNFACFPVIEDIIQVHSDVKEIADEAKNG